MALFFCPKSEEGGFAMSQRNHDPTETGMPECNTTGTLRETLERLKDEPDFHITVEIGGETDDGDPVQPG